MKTTLRFMTVEDKTIFEIDVWHERDQNLSKTISELEAEYGAVFLPYLGKIKV